MKTLNKNLVKSLAISFFLLFSFVKLNAQSTLDQNNLGPVTGNALYGVGAGGNGINTGLFRIIPAATGINNTFIGIGAGAINAIGYNNTFIGISTGATNNAGYDNTIVGTGSGVSNTNGFENTFLGSNSGISNVGGDKNTFTGFGSGAAADGDDNTVNGYKSGFNLSGSDNTFIGSHSGYNTSGWGNVFNGYFSGYSNNAGQDNTFIGNGSGFTNDDAQENVFVGLFSGYANDHGEKNAFIGSMSGYNSTGDYNAFMGQEAGTNIVTGDNNVIVGAYAGSSYLNSASSGMVLLGTNADASSSATGVTFTNAGAIGKDAEVDEDNVISIGQIGTPTRVCIGYEGVNTYSLPNAATDMFYVNGDCYASGVKLLSDATLKTNIKTIWNGLEYIKKLNPVSYDFKQNTIFNLPSEIQYGFIAQELQKILPNVVSGNDKGIHTVNYIAIIPVLTKAIQEQQAIIDQNKLENAKLNEKFKTIEKKLLDLAKSFESKNGEIEVLETKLNNQAKLVEDKINELNRSLTNLNSCCEINRLNKTNSDINTINPTNTKNISTITLNNIARLDQNKPNPFTNETFIDYYIPTGSEVSKIEIFDQMGKKVFTFNILNFGEGRLVIKNGGLASGIYNYNLIIGNKIIDNYKMQILSN